MVSGYFDQRERLYDEPIYRNVWGLLREFGDAELVRWSCRAACTSFAVMPPAVTGPPPAKPGRAGAAPGKLTTPTLAAVKAELSRYEKTPFFKVTVLLPRRAYLLTRGR